MPKRQPQKRNPPRSLAGLLTLKTWRVILKKPMLKKLGVICIWLSIAPITLAFTAVSLYSLTPLKSKTQSNIQDGTSISNHVSGKVLGEAVSDFRPIRVARFLKGTPLEKFSDEIVAVSDKYGIDYRLIPAIAMKESGAGRVTPKESFNAWGFENGKTRFESWEQAIESVAKTLKTRYVAKGLDTPDKMMPVYAPPAMENGGGWAIAINSYLAQMESTESNL